MKQIARVCIFTLLAAGIVGQVAGQAYPNKPIRMIIPAAPGGGTDTIGRTLGQKLSEALGQPVVADNRPGAGTIIGSEMTANSPPDGYTFLLVTNSHAINASVHRKILKYDPIKSFMEIALIANSPYMLVVHPSVHAKSVNELIDIARKQSGQLLFGSAGSASATHLAGELFKAMTKINVVHVPYKGGSPAVTALVGGHVQFMFNSLISVSAHAKAGRLRAIAVTSSKRLTVMPDIPTVAEAGVPGYEASAWYGALFPGGTPARFVNVLSREIVNALKLPDVRERLESQGAEVIGSTPEEFSRYMREDIARWAKLVPTLNLQ